MADAATQRKLAEAADAVAAMRAAGVEEIHVQSIERLRRAHRGMAQTCSALWHDNRALREGADQAHEEAHHG